MFGGIEEERYISHILFQVSTKILIILLPLIAHNS